MTKIILNAVTIALGIQIAGAIESIVHFARAMHYLP